VTDVILATGHSRNYLSEKEAENQSYAKENNLFYQGPGSDLLLFLSLIRQWCFLAILFLIHRKTSIDRHRNEDEGPNLAEWNQDEALKYLTDFDLEKTFLSETELGEKYYFLL
jgi:hypothetical protein